MSLRAVGEDRRRDPGGGGVMMGGGRRGREGAGDSGDTRTGGRSEVDLRDKTGGQTGGMLVGWLLNVPGSG